MDTEVTDDRRPQPELASARLPPARASSLAGSGVVECVKVGNRTVARRLFAASPLRLLNPANNGHACWIYSSTYGGGLVDGDALSLDVRVRTGATVFLSTQASTKVYRSPSGTTQQLRAVVEAGAGLIMLPDPVTCFAGAAYQQRQSVSLDPAASLVLIDRLTAGRMASAERWMFSSYLARTIVWRGNRPLVYDALALRPEDGDLVRRMGRFNCVATVILAGPASAVAAERWLTDSGRRPIEQQADWIATVAPLGQDGAFARLAGRSSEQIDGILRERLSVVPSVLGDDPWTRRW